MKTDILGIEILLTSLHTKGAGHVSFTTACSAGDKKDSGVQIYIRKLQVG